MRNNLILISISILSIFISCQDSNNKLSSDKPNNEKNNSIIFEGMEFTDGLGVSLTTINKDTIHALGIYISYRKLNDSTFEIKYPLKPIEVYADFQKYGNSESVEIEMEKMGTGIFTNKYSKKNKKIYFGSDMLKYEVLENKRIRIYFPKRSIWKVRKIDNGIEVYGEKKSYKYWKIIG
jgi:hypothetical protein